MARHHFWECCAFHRHTRTKINGSCFSDLMTLLLLTIFRWFIETHTIPSHFHVNWLLCCAQKKGTLVEMLKYTVAFDHYIIIQNQRWHSLGIRNAFHVCSLIVVWTSKANRERKSNFNLFSFCLIFSCFNVQWPHRKYEISCENSKKKRREKKKWKKIIMRARIITWPFVIVFFYLEIQIVFSRAENACLDSAMGMTFKK